MQTDCEVYVDPDEDEVFFGCVSDRERNLCWKVAKPTDSSANDDQNKTSNHDADEMSTLITEQSIREIAINETDKESNNTTIELDHNYSTPMKNKIDKTILTTPKSVVKADKDGGFLKVLSEIALVKAEAEADKMEEKKEDEDKENQIIRPVPVIRVTEATPEKPSFVSPPKSLSSQSRRFRIIYNSPQSEDNVDLGKSKTEVEKFESSKNLKNKVQDLNVSGVENILNNDSIDVIDFDKSDISKEILNKNDKTEERNVDEEKPENCIICPPVEEKEKGSKDEVAGSQPATDKVDDEPEIIAVVSSSDEVKSPKKPETVTKLPPSYRFSKEARKIVEVLRKNTVDETLDFTIDEIDVENVENSLLCSEPISLDVTVVPNPESQPEKIQSPKVSEGIGNMLEIRPKTVEKDRHKLTPVLSQNRIQGVKCFSERSIPSQFGNGVKRCVKKLPMEDKKPLTEQKGCKTSEKIMGAAPSSRIPVFGVKSSRIPLHSTERVRTVSAKKTPTGKTYNPKYKNIESPINAYINNKPTSLVLNVKPEVKKGPLTKVWRPETAGTARKAEKSSRVETPSAKSVRLPFVEYKSGTPYEIEKRAETRLPRLAPTVQKLIGYHSPRVLKHEGRFYVHTPGTVRGSASVEDTIQVDPNKVSLVVSQAAQKSAVKNSGITSHYQNAPVEGENKRNKQTKEGEEKGLSREQEKGVHCGVAVIGSRFLPHSRLRLPQNKAKNDR